jgi:polyferredoxin
MAATHSPDLLRIPALGRLLRWRWGRLVFQVAALVVAGVMIYDGFTGDPIASANLSTIISWVEIRGLVILGLLFIGNLFCFACPFTLLRTITPRLSLAGWRWPRRLRSKWLSVGALILIFWLYEWLDLWAVPAFTATLILAYFTLSFVLEAAFQNSPFCKYLCPIGAFNFSYATLSPFIISARSNNICRQCPGKECIRSSAKVAGCGTDLFVPTLHTNLDCTLCLDCARACPYDNVSLRPVTPTRQLQDPRLASGWDRAVLILGLAALGIANAYGMIPPAAALDAWLASLGLAPEALRLFVVFAVMGAILPLTLVWFAGTASHWITQRTEAPRRLVARYAPAFVPMGMGIWLAHYGFHFAIGALTLVPASQAFLADHGMLPGAMLPNWGLGPLLPQDWIFPIQVLAIVAGYLAALFVLGRAALSAGRPPLRALAEILPWAGLLLLLTIASLAVFTQPMQPRGGPGFTGV